MTLDRPAYSYRSDNNVPDFPDQMPLTVMDATCGLCAHGARWIAYNDRKQQFRIAPVQSNLGRELLIHYGMNPADPTSWLFIQDGVAFSSLDALIAVGSRLGGIWRVLKILKIVPSPARDYLYRLVARNRYRFFGRTDLCQLPDTEIQKRLLV